MQVGSFILVYVECKVAIPMVSTRKTDDDHHVTDSEAIGRLRHELIKSTGNPRISSGVKLSNSTSSSSKSVSTKYSLKKRCKSASIGLYRDVWIAAIASSTTSLATRTAAICVRFQGRRVRRVYVTMQITFLTRKSALIYVRESPASLSIAMAISR